MMATVQRFEDLRVWQTARQLTRTIYTLTAANAFARDFGLRDQIQRASVSVMSNIAEGFETRTQRHFADYLGRAKASAGEVRCQLYIALDLGYIDQTQFDEAYDLADKAARQLYHFAKHVSSRSYQARVREDPSSYDPDGHSPLGPLPSNDNGTSPADDPTF